MRYRVAPNRAAALSIAILASLLALTISGVFAATAGAAETRSLTPSADTKIKQNAPTTNYVAATSLGVNGNIPSGSGKDEVALIKWDLSGIAPRTQVSSASVTLRVTTASSQTYQAYVLKQPWVESAATWNVYGSGKPWEVAGAKGSLDREATVAGSITPSVEGNNTFTLPLAVVQGWVDNPATNHGIIIAKPSSTLGFIFKSREDSDPTRRPQLTLNLNPDTTPPPDTDSDTVSDSSDNCPLAPNQDQADFDGDDLGNVCDSDRDGDGVPNDQDYAPDDPNVPDPPSTGTFPGIRWIPTMGVYENSSAGWRSEPGLIQRQYGDYVGTSENAYLDLDADNERYYFCGGRKYEWSDMLVDQTLAPSSRAQAQDPNWSNYKWNQLDVIDEMLDASTAVQQQKAKACIFVATTATAQPDPVPAWLEQDPDSLTWTDGQGKVHVRLDKTEGWQAVTDFMIALTKRYGDDRRVASITMGEYYTNADGGGLPADLDYSLFKSNAKLLWQEWIAAAPKDANNERITLAQSQPIAAGREVEASDIRSIGIGVSGSSASLFQSQAVDELRRDLYGDVPLQHQVNAGSVGNPATFDGTPNPWGYGAGQTITSEYQHIAWYYSSKAEGSKIPLDSLMMGDNANLVSQWHTAYAQFGPNGSLTAQWGQVPNHPAQP